MTPTVEATTSMPNRSTGFTIRAILLSAAGLFIITLLVWSVSGIGRSSSNHATDSDIALSTMMSFDITTIASGELEALNQVEIRNPLKRQSTITHIIDEGTWVEAGEVLFQLNAEDIQTPLDEELLKLEISRNELSEANSSYNIQLSDNQSKLRKAELDMELAGLTLQQWIAGDDIKKNKQFRVAVESAVRDLERLTKKFQESSKLIKKGFLSQDEYKLDEIKLAEAQAKHEIALLDLESYTSYQRPRDEKSKRAEVLNTKEELGRVREQNDINLRSKDANRQAKARQLALREQKVQKLQQEIDSTTILAPSGGMVVYSTSLNNRGWRGDGPLQVGQQLSGNELAIVLPDTSEMVASVRVHESLAGRIAPGQRAQVRIDAVQGRTFTGTVESIGVLAESGGWRDPNRREYTVRIALDAVENNTLKPSMRCEAEIVLGHVKDSLSVPAQAIFSDGPIKFVYTQQGGKINRKVVQIGRRSSMYTEIISGLDQGASVLLREPSAGEVPPADWSESELASSTPKPASKDHTKKVADKGSTQVIQTSNTTEPAREQSQGSSSGG